MNIEEQFDMWESELSFRERAEMALDFIETHHTAYGTIIASNLYEDTAIIHYDLQTEFMKYLRNIYEEQETDREEYMDEPWVNHDYNVEDDYHRYG